MGEGGDRLGRRDPLAFGRAPPRQARSTCRIRAMERAEEPSRIDEAPPSGPKARVPASAEKKPIHWLLEGAFIVFSVMLGFAATKYGEYRDDRELASRMLAGIRAEVEFNR